MTTKNTKKEQRTRRRARIRSKVSGTAEVPRLSVFKSNKSISVQLINDQTGTTLVAGTTAKIAKGTQTEKALALGEQLAKEAQSKKIEKVVFDRGGYIFAGLVKAVAEGARKGGLIF